MKLKYLIPMFLLLLLVVCPAQAWYQTYCYRQLHNITGSSSWGGSLTNHEVMLIVDTGVGASSGSTVYLDSHSEADLDDLRITDTSDNLLEYWIESTGNPYNVWVKIPTLTTGTNQIYIYYGNSSASSYSNGWNVFNLYDHFDEASLNTTTWTQSGGTVTIASSIINVTATASAYHGIYSDTTFGVNFSYRSRTKPVTHSSGNAGTDFGDQVNAPPMNYYNGFFQYDAGGSSFFNRHYTKNDAVTGSTTGLATDRNNYDIYEEIRNGSTSSIYLRNGVSNTLTTGINTQSIPVNFWGYYSTSKIFSDWIIVRDYRYPEPAHSDWGAEETRPAPVADFTSNVTEVFPLDYIQFTDATTNTPTAWDWYFPNGVDSHIQNPKYTFDLVIGNTITWYNVSLNASHCGGYDWENKTDYFVAYPLNASYNANITSGCSPLIVQFTDATDNGTPTTWWWDFNEDGIVDDTNQSPIYTYNSAGTYSVYLNVSNVYSWDWENQTNYITVSSTPVADFTANDTLGDYPLPVAFTDLSTNTPSTWNWSFGDGNFSELQNPTYTYTFDGLFTVNLTATNACGSTTESKTDYINVTAPVGPTPTPTTTTASAAPQAYIPARGASMSGITDVMIVGVFASLIIVSMLGVFLLVLSRRRRYDDEW